MKKINELFAGKRSYIVSGATVLFAVLGVVLGYMEPARALEMILMALGLASIRATKKLN